jgi:hypothetical protein
LIRCSVSTQRTFSTNPTTPSRRGCPLQANGARAGRYQSEYPPYGDTPLSVRLLRCSLVKDRKRCSCSTCDHSLRFSSQPFRVGDRGNDSRPEGSVNTPAGFFWKR